MGACSSKPRTSDFDHANVTINLDQEGGGGGGEEDEELANCFSVRHSNLENILTDGAVSKSIHCVGEALMDSSFDQSLCHHVEEKLAPTDDQDLHIVQLNCSEEKQSLRILSDGAEMFSAEMKDQNVLLQNNPGVENGGNWIYYQNKSKESTIAMVADIGDVMAADVKKELFLDNGILHHNEQKFTSFVNTPDSEVNEVYAAEAIGSRLQKDDSKSQANMDVMQAITIPLKEGEDVSCQKIGSGENMHIECNESVNKAMASNNNGNVEETADIKEELSLHSGAIYHNEKDFSTFVGTFSKENEVYKTDVYAKDEKSSIPQGNKEVQESIATAKLHRLSCGELIRDESKRQCDVEERIAKSGDLGENFCSVIQGKEGKENLRKDYWHLDMYIPPVNATVLRQSDLEHTPILRDSLVRLCSTLAEEMQDYSDISQGKVNVNAIKPVDSAPEVYAESLIRYCNTLGDTNTQSMQDTDILVRNIAKSLDSVSEVNTESLAVPLNKDPLSIKASELVTIMDGFPSMNNEEKNSEPNLHPKLPLDILSEYTVDNMKKQNPEMQNNVVIDSNGNMELAGIAHISLSNTSMLTELSVLNHINGVEGSSSLVMKGMAESIDKEMIDNSLARSSVNADICIASKMMAGTLFESRKAIHEQNSTKEVKGLLMNEQEDKVVTIKKFNKDFQSHTAVEDNGNPNIDEILEKLASEFVRQENKYCTPQTLS